MLLLFGKKLYNRFVELLKLLKNCLLQSMSYIIKTVLRSHLTASQEKPAHRANQRSPCKIPLKKIHVMSRTDVIVMSRTDAQNGLDFQSSTLSQAPP